MKKKSKGKKGKKGHKGEVKDVDFLLGKLSLEHRTLTSKYFKKKQLDL
jgi:hypothetical protein